MRLSFFARGRASRHGFTLIELLAVIAIIGLMLAVGVVSFTGARRGAEMRAAVGSVRSAVSLARQHAVARRRTVALVFRTETDAEGRSRNCYYVFEKNGTAVAGSAGTMLVVPANTIAWPSDGALVYNMTGDRIGTLQTSDPQDDSRRQVNWIETGGAGWNPGDDFGFQVGEKFFVPPGIRVLVDGSERGVILFYANGRTSGDGVRQLTLIDRLRETTTRTLEIYPIIGIVRMQ